ncbi:MAG: GDP-mannose 4,6-dehydratase [Candidatus Coatesbacteria bacterium]|nr:MAG: GDP-mannose 4,6-dehydratase [Candidatus Coatesbacteria bacterium]
MKRVLVTGAAGFIGSHLTERLCEDGYEVTGIDSFLDNYQRGLKEENLKRLLDYEDFSFIEADLNEIGLTPVLDGISAVFHLAARPGVRDSWGLHFDEYLSNNVLATQKLLEALKDRPDVFFLYASSSSVYGDADVLPVTEETPPRPVSPYGATKLAAEDMFDLYKREYGTRVTTLRLFSVYGPRQRPDMAVHKFLTAVAAGKPITVYGDGSSGRDYTYVDYVVDAYVKIAEKGIEGAVFNVASGKITTLNELIKVVESALGKKAIVERLPGQPGDVGTTHADISRLEEAIGFDPNTDVLEGIAKQATYLKGAGLI